MIDFTVGSNLLITVILIFSTGIVAGLSPCTLPTAAFVAAYVSGKKDFSKKSGFVISLFFILGITTTLTLLGIFSGILGDLLNNTTILNVTLKDCNTAVCVNEPQSFIAYINLRDNKWALMFINLLSVFIAFMIVIINY